MMKSKFIAAIQEATDRTSLPLEWEAIEWALYSPYEQKKAFEHYAHKDLGEESEVVMADVMIKGSADQADRHVLAFNLADWNRMTLKQHHQVFQLLERIVLGKKPRLSVVRSSEMVLQ
jgi:hypothetical protein